MISVEKVCVWDQVGLKGLNRRTSWTVTMRFNLVAFFLASRAPGKMIRTWSFLFLALENVIEERLNLIDLEYTKNT